MLYYLHYYSGYLGILNVFKYITFRAMGAAITSLVLCWLLGRPMISLLRKLKAGQPIRGKEVVKDLAALHGTKSGTPTMGGLLILLAVSLSCLIWVIPTNKFFWLSLLSMLFMGGIGFWDDFKKVIQKKHYGISGKIKLLAQAIVGVVVGIVLLADPETSRLAQKLTIPFLKEVKHIDIGWMAIPFFILVVMGSSNAVNLTDGLDGLAAGCTIGVAFVYAVFSYISGRADMSGYLFLPYIKGAGELTIFCSALIGACMGFLWYNCYPAAVFMGDTGSLAIGSALGVVAIILCQELLLVIAGGIFVIEAASVILQVASFKLTGKRLFAMAPLHHHFELKGWSETAVTVRFWILSLLFGLLALSSLKIR
ncbi:phospho-N-acetylmuramoyl-pentapeptide-transferase [Candidatus Methylacidiphilum infernorum]|uniref:Phospho-N-acetylmuramoyl-pentapeptide-transferase n=1 Tax=Candidatus Methylacidiphilum infernorum TaxID=511746 RepID=A0ABX7PWE0_9BACT|nr:phospho-N-acetylmuramoyl-pentapeptide-transferase [Candidatus Methylacidiphilum infernorum]QSR87044.1 phospho-N-acetylmuramoyl-pentapeptide-transferase [Candidatus Methylacidiphilum infernorum]